MAKRKVKATSKSKESKTSARRLRAARKQVRALELRITGLSYREIARELKYKGPSGSFKAVDAALKRNVYDRTEEIVNLELDRLDEMQVVAWKHVTVAGDLKAIDRVLKIMERRSKLLGLDYPIQYSLEDIRSIARKVHNVISAEIADEAARDRIFAALGFTEAETSD